METALRIEPDVAEDVADREAANPAVIVGTQGEPPGLVAGDFVGARSGKAQA